MTIKELENKTGMTRANIRFYEGEGLISPRRLDNGYRDYSEEDARTLEKIKLLRQLQLDIDTIRRVQQGALTLEQALFTQMTRLEGDKAVIERAAEVCRALERSGVEYAALDPQPYLQQLKGPPQPALSDPPHPPPREEQDDAPKACCHPWQRWLARSLDMTLYEMLINVVWLLVTRDQGFLRLQTANVFTRWVWGVLMLFLALLAEPLWLHFWGWTPGKWVFGLTLRYENGDKLNLSDARLRCWELAGEGYGWNIPIWSLYRMWQCRKEGLDGEDCSWDWKLRYTKEERRFSGWIFAGVNALCIAALFLGLLHTQTPLNRGPLTVAEFSENYNYYFRQLLDQDSTRLPTLDEDGRWVEEEPDYGYGTVVVDLTGGATQCDDPEFTVTDGYVTAVTLHMESSGWMVGTGTEETLALLALSGSAEGTDLFHYDLAGWNRTAQETLYQWEDAELDYRGLHISQQAAYSGYYAVSGGVLFSEDENVPGHCEKTVTISLIP